jgi:hypothetical protein
MYQQFIDLAQALLTGSILIGVAAAWVVRRW